MHCPQMPEAASVFLEVVQVRLVCRFGVSRALYEEFLRPLLLVGLFAPPEELSAAAVLGTFYFYSAAPPCTDLFCNMECSRSNPGLRQDASHRLVAKSTQRCLGADNQLYTHCQNHFRKA